MGRRVDRKKVKRRGGGGGAPFDATQIRRGILRSIGSDVFSLSVFRSSFEASLSIFASGVPSVACRALLFENGGRSLSQDGQDESGFWSVLRFEFVLLGAQITVTTKTTAECQGATGRQQVWTPQFPPFLWSFLSLVRSNRGESSQWGSQFSIFHLPRYCQCCWQHALALSALSRLSRLPRNAKWPGPDPDLTG